MLTGVFPSDLTRVDNTLYFYGGRRAFGVMHSLWESDGTEAGTVATLDTVALDPVVSIFLSAELPNGDLVYSGYNDEVGNEWFVFGRKVTCFLVSNI